MSFEEFSRYIQENNSGRVPTKKEYNTVQDRIKYFFKKIRKLGVSE